MFEHTPSHAMFFPYLDFFLDFRFIILKKSNIRTRYM